MLKSQKAFLNIPILSVQSSYVIGHAYEFIVDPTTGIVVGIVGFRKGIFFKKHKVISMVDVREISSKAVVVDNDDALVWQKEIIQLDMILRSKIKIIGAKVMTTGGENMGKVYDYLIDDYFQVAKLYIYPPITNILKNQIIVSRDNIMEIRKNVIIIDIDNKIKDTETAKVLS